MYTWYNATNYLSMSYLADQEHHRSLASPHPPDIVQTSHAVLHGDQNLSSLQSSPGGVNNNKP